MHLKRLLRADAEIGKLERQPARVRMMRVQVHDDQHRVRAVLDPRNTPSAALCRRLGMRQEAHFVEDLWFKGEWGDTAVYAILAREWTAGALSVH